jgi:hypothetical protein
MFSRNLSKYIRNKSQQALAPGMRSSFDKEETLEEEGLPATRAQDFFCIASGIESGGDGFNNWRKKCCFSSQSKYQSSMLYETGQNHSRSHVNGTSRGSVTFLSMSNGVPAIRAAVAASNECGSRGKENVWTISGAKNKLVNGFYCYNIFKRGKQALAYNVCRLQRTVQAQEAEQNRL